MEGSDAPHAKRPRHEDGAAVPSSERPIFDAENLAAACKTAQWVKQPFPHAVVHGLFDERFLRGLQKELVSAEFETQSIAVSELFAVDLEGSSLPLVSRLRDALFGGDGRFKELMQGLSPGHTLTDIKDMLALVLRRNGYLLCHRDTTPTRRIGFEIFLVPEDYAATDGGAFELFACEEAMHTASADDQNGTEKGVVAPVPTEATVRITPKFGDVVFWERGDATYTQIAEVTQSERPRLSISGWFHSTADIESLPAQMPAPMRISPAVVPSASMIQAMPRLGEWLDDRYLDDDALEAVQSELVDNSSIALDCFLRPERYSALLKAIRDLPPDSWRQCGRPHEKKHMTLRPRDEGSDSASSGIGGVVGEFGDFLRSSEFSWFLKRVSNLTLGPFSMSIDQYSHGHYALNRDEQADEPSALDVVFIAVDQTWAEQCGGYQTYLTGEEELLSVFGEENTLSLVYRDTGTMKCTKYVNATAQGAKTDFALSFRVEDAEEDDDDDDDDNGCDERDNDAKGN